jgi:glutamate dehydrogenase
MDASAVADAAESERRDLAEALNATFGPAARSDGVAAFISQVCRQSGPEELGALSADEIADALAGLWRFGDERRGLSASIRLTPAAGGGVEFLEIAQDDAPFLVDSAMGELAARGVEVRSLFHPVADQPSRAARQSLILAVLGPVGDDRRGEIEAALAEVLADVHAAVDDFESMIELMEQTIAELSESAAPPQAYGIEEHLAFLRWITADRFVFLGARVYSYPRGPDGRYLREQPTFNEAEGLGLLRDPACSVLRAASEPAVLAEDPMAYLAHAPAVVVAKSNLRSRVHRRTHMDYIGISRYGPDGLPIGQIRFVGLFTAAAYEEAARTIPLVRSKIERVLARGQATPSKHVERQLRHIVETYPRDELFQIDEETLLRAATGIQHLYDRPRVRLFVWKDPFDRFRSVLLFTPRDRYNGDTPRKAAEIIARAWGGRVSAVYPRFSDEPLARIQVVVGLDPGEHPDPDIVALEAEISEALRGWPDRFESAVRNGGVPDEAVGATLEGWREAFPAGYRDRYDPAEALADLRELESLACDEVGLRVRPYRLPHDPPTRFRFKLYVAGGKAPLSDVLPVLEHMGLRGLDEAGFAIQPSGSPIELWVHEFELEDAYGRPVAFDDIKAPFSDAFAAIWNGQADCDGFNRLVIELGVSWREAALIRALARWRQQSGLDPSQAVQEAALREHAGVARLILDLFRIKFDPALHAAVEERRTQATAVRAEIDQALMAVQSLDDDRVLRRIAQAVGIMTRTNYYQAGAGGEPKPYLSFKIASQEADALPSPKPFREIFVSGPRVEGVHLRFGPVARGGLRWSDRRDDYRTEVLGLVRTQQVKNAVIVPVGSKGGFYPKQLPTGAAPEAVRAEGVEAYKVFLDGLLDLTDNLDAEGKVVRPDGVVAHDADDPYLVVAADKGTATFSDIANGVAQSYGFWLDDAFASGGSAGYDHKAMGITARGAWEAVKRHFRELGRDIQTEPFTCIGVGDMSGDVFGNGMLLSKATRLIAAFDHRHVFIDPNPDPETSWAERKRLFDLPRSSWADYDPAAISPGGAVFSRAAKEIELTPEIKALFGLSEDTMTPADLIRAVLTAQADLLYLGGIGTYVKAPVESHADVADKANDAIRIDASDLRCLVVGEGANLGFTQAARIAFARAGGRINTDAIDNSAGVDTSDHEVNIKILTGQAIRAGKLAAEERDPLLRSMTDDVAQHVLAHNYAQTLTLSLQEADAAADLDAHARFLAALVDSGKLDRKVEGLPGPAAIAELKAHGKGLTRPELAVVMAYAKLELSAEIVAGPAPDDPYFEVVLEDYFPDQLAAFDAEMKGHRLRREIIATVLANAMVDMAGPTFATRLQAALGCDAATASVAFQAARRMFRLDEAWAEVSALDLKVPAATQLALYREIAQSVRGQTYWLARRAGAGDTPSVREVIDLYRPAVDALQAAGPELLSDFDREQAQARRRALAAAGTPDHLAMTVADLGALRAAVDIADLARKSDWPVEDAARLFHRLGALLGLDKLRMIAAGLASADAYERLAVRRLIVDLADLQAAAAAKAAAKSVETAADAAIAAWRKPRKAAVDRALATVADIGSGMEPWSFAKLTLAAAALREAVG